jgi:hypothetical protein
VSNAQTTDEIASWKLGQKFPGFRPEIRLAIPEKKETRSGFALEQTVAPSGTCPVSSEENRDGDKASAGRKTGTGHPSAVLRSVIPRKPGRAHSAGLCSRQERFGTGALLCTDWIRTGLHGIQPAALRLRHRHRSGLHRHRWKQIGPEGDVRTGAVGVDPHGALIGALDQRSIQGRSNGCHSGPTQKHVQK